MYSSDESYGNFEVRRSARARAPVLQEQYYFEDSPRPRRARGAAAYEEEPTSSSSESEEESDSYSRRRPPPTRNRKPVRSAARGTRREAARGVSYAEDDDEGEEDEEVMDMEVMELAPVKVIQRPNEFTIDRILDHIECGLNVEPDFGTGYAGQYTFIDTKEKYTMPTSTDDTNGEQSVQSGLSEDGTSSSSGSPMDTVALINADPRAGPIVRKYLIKWVESSYLHNSWNTEEELSRWGVGGLKKLRNYETKIRDQEYFLSHSTAEDVEQSRVLQELAREAVTHGMTAERIIDVRDIHPEDERQLYWCYIRRRGGGLGPDMKSEEEKQEYAQGVDEDVWQTQALVKWEGVGYDECTWENMATVTTPPVGNQDILDDFRNRGMCMFTQHRPNKHFMRLLHQPAHLGGVTATIASTVDPLQGVTDETAAARAERVERFLAGKQLRGYQLEGVNWIYHNWCRDINGILADEMGLGKTIQCVCLLSHLYHACDLPGPFLVVVPLSTIHNWHREFLKWAPALNTVLFIGSSAAREVIRKHELFHDHGGRGSRGRVAKFNVLLTTYEFVTKDKATLGGIHWRYLIVDEAHRLKDKNAQLYKALQDFHTDARLLVTGTPLQNSVRELWCLLNFLHPGRFGSLEHFEAEYGGIRDEEQITRLHSLLQPHLLRRVKRDVLKAMPGKTERIVRVELTHVQKRVYRYVLTRNVKELAKGIKGGKASLTNIIMELKKCCNHPNLFPEARFEAREEELAATEQQMRAMKWEVHPPAGSTLPSLIVPEHQRRRLARIVRKSGKLALLDRMLVRLYEEGHRVLIFSQMVKMLDILADYLSLRGFLHQRLDGGMRAQDRQTAMDRYNAPGSRYFCFLLSTRAGGLGVNLATADTVIIYDSDWNPQNDLQAEARAHRLGQKNTVSIFRMVTRDTVEEKILEKAKKKMILDHLIIQRMDTRGAAQGSGNAIFDAKELNKILQFGAENLFKEESTAMPAAGVDVVGNDVDDDATTGTTATTTPNAGEAGTSTSTGTGSFTDSLVLPSMTGPLAPGAVLSDGELVELLARPSVEEAAAAEEESGDAEDQTEAFLAAFKVADFTGGFGAGEGTVDAGVDAANAGASDSGSDDDDDDGGDGDLWRRLLPEAEADGVTAAGLSLDALVEGPRHRASVRYTEAVEDSDDDGEGGRRRGGAGNGWSVRDSQRIVKALMLQGGVDGAVEWLSGRPWGRKRGIPDREEIRSALTAIVESSIEAVVEAENKMKDKKPTRGDDDDDDDEKKNRRKVWVSWGGMDLNAAEIVRSLTEINVLQHTVEKELLRQDRSMNGGRIGLALSKVKVDAHGKRVAEDREGDNAGDGQLRTVLSQIISDNGLCAPSTLSPSPAPTPELWQYLAQSGGVSASADNTNTTGTTAAVTSTTATADATPFALLSWRLPVDAPMVKRWDSRLKWGVKDDAMLAVGAYLYGPGNIDMILGDERLGLRQKLIVPVEVPAEVTPTTTTATATTAAEPVTTVAAADMSDTTAPITTSTAADATAALDAVAKSSPMTDTDVSTTTTTPASAPVADAAPAALAPAVAHAPAVGDNTTSPSAPASAGVNAGAEATPTATAAVNDGGAVGDASSTPIFDDDGFRVSVGPGEVQLVRNQVLVNRIWVLLRCLHSWCVRQEEIRAAEAEREAQRQAKLQSKRDAVDAKKRAREEERKKAATAKEEEKRKEKEKREEEKRKEKERKEEEKKRLKEEKSKSKSKPEGESSTSRKRAVPKKSEESDDASSSNEEDGKRSKAEKRRRVEGSGSSSQSKNKSGDEGKTTASSSSGGSSSSANRSSNSSGAKAKEEILEGDGFSFPLDRDILNWCKKDLDKKEGAAMALKGLLTITRSEGGWKDAENRKNSVPLIMTIGALIDGIVTEYKDLDPAKQVENSERVRVHLWHYAAKYAGQSGKAFRSVYNGLIEKEKRSGAV